MMGSKRRTMPQKVHHAAYWFTEVLPSTDLGVAEVLGAANLCLLEWMPAGGPPPECDLFSLPSDLYQDEHTEL
jgi:hypothetical protein